MNVKGSVVFQANYSKDGFDDLIHNELKVPDRGEAATKGKARERIHHGAVDNRTNVRSVEVDSSYFVVRKNNVLNENIFIVDAMDAVVAASPQGAVHDDNVRSGVDLSRANEGTKGSHEGSVSKSNESTKALKEGVGSGHADSVTLQVDDSIVSGARDDRVKAQLDVLSDHLGCK